MKELVADGFKNRKAQRQGLTHSSTTTNGGTTINEFFEISPTTR